MHFRGADRVVFIAVWILLSSAVRADDFDAVVAPLLARKCLGCHNATDKKGGLNLASATAARAGGESGEIIVAEKPEESLLWEKVSQNEMPPKKPLANDEKEILRRWLAGGAKWGTDPIDLFKYTSATRAGYDWWSLRPLKRPELPSGTDDGQVRNPIDRFILAGLRARGLRLSPEADKRTLIRRLSFDLLGLPPNPSDVARFLADERPDAYARLVERLLESPHYGERWGRHWLDVVRFGESQGFERDKLRPNSWPYRDWVIAAFNDDLPYDEFVRLQLAGDVLYPADPRAVIATGFLVAAPWDEVGQTQQSAAMKAVVRQDELEDLIGVTGQTFLGLTVNCARCHDHKFDPVSQIEYYRMAADFAGVRHGERESRSPDAAGKDDRGAAVRRGELAQIEKRLDDGLAAFDAPVRQRILERRKTAPAPTVALPRPIARWEFDGDLKDSIGGLHGTARGMARVEDGQLLLDGKDSYVETAPLESELTARSLDVWVRLANLEQHGGGAITIQSSSGAIFDSIVFGEKEPGQWMAGSNGYSRTQSFHAPLEREADKSIVKITIVYHADRTVTGYRNGHRYGSPYTAPSLATYEAGKSQVLFGLRHSPPGGDRFLAGAIDRAALYDRALTPDEVAALAGVASDVVTDDQLLAELSSDSLRSREQLVFELSRVRSQMRLVNGGRVYAVNAAPPEPTFILDRGNPAQKRDVALPGAIKSLGGLSPDFGLDAEASEGDRRR
jgi:mono/diheme cytochrome c family protein